MSPPEATSLRYPADMRRPEIRPLSALRVRRRHWRAPLLRPAAGRRLPAALRPEAVYLSASQFAGGLHDPAFPALLSRIDQGPFHNDTRVQTYFDGASAFAAMLAAIHAARHEILLESYIFSGDATGLKVLDALRLAAARGVVVRVLADAFGSSGTRGDFWHLLRQSGSRLRLFRRPRYAPRPLLPILDHRKILVVDRHIGFTGGMNIADEYHAGTATERVWRDTHVRVTGNIAWELALLFSESWTAAGGQPLRVESRPSTGLQHSPSLVLDSRPGRGIQEVHSAFAAIMGASRQRLWLTNAYFAPSRALLRKLKMTAQRGVDVRLLLPRRSDIPLIRAASQAYYAEMMRSGIRVFEYLPAVLHAKTLVADSLVSVIGSSNFDTRSFTLNHECNVLCLDARVAAELEAQFLLDLGCAEELNLELWQRRGWVHKFLQFLARMLAPIL